MVYNLFGGSCAGVMFFLTAYPFDYVKTLMQTDNFETNQSKYKGMLDVIQK